MEEYDDDDEEKLIRYAEFYRKRLESKIDEPLVSDNGEPRDPPKWLRSARAESLWRSVTGSNPPEDWSVDEIVTALVVRAFGRLVGEGEGEGEGGVDGEGD
jgi:hypothetical protein